MATTNGRNDQALLFAGVSQNKSVHFTASDSDPRSVPRALRIVVADDDRDATLTLMMLLREEGHEVRAVHSGRQVMAAVLDFAPDAVLLDIAMPGLSGWEVARTIKERRGKFSPMLIGISGEYKQGVDKILSELIGFDHYLLKPYDPNVLLALLAPLRLPQSGD
jgi:DNA-binding response OmpR family regulator